MSGYGLNYHRRSFFPQLIRIILVIATVVVLSFAAYSSFIYVKELFFSRDMYVGSTESRVQLIEDFNTLSLSLDDVPRGAKVTTYGMGKKIEVSNEKFYRVTYKNPSGETIEGYIDANNIVEKYEDVVYEKEVYALSNTYISDTSDFLTLSANVTKGEKFTITGWDLNPNGTVEWYYLENIDRKGYSSGKYFSENQASALLNYDINKYFSSKDLLHLDFRPRLKNDFMSNPRVDELRAWYLTAENLITVTDFITEAKKTNINTFVIDFKVNEGITYESQIVGELASKTVNLTDFSKHQLAEIVKLLKDNNIYTVARIEIFKDQGYALSNPESTIKYKDGRDFDDGYGNFYVNPESKDSWSYNLLIAKEAVEVGFNEVLLDFVRYPNVKLSIDDQLDYTEYTSKEEQIQTFSRYMYDQLSREEVYVSATTLGQVAYFEKSDGLIHGQQWHMMSNIYDYLYPRMFIENYASSYLSGRSPFKYQYDMIYLLNTEANQLNQIISKAAEIRPIIQCYNNWGYYDWQNIDGKRLERQIQAIYDNGNKGFVAWTDDDTIEKYLYSDRLEAFKVEYIKSEYSGSFE